MYVEVIPPQLLKMSWKKLFPFGLMILAMITGVNPTGCPEGTWVTRVFVTANSPAYTSSVVVGFL